MDVLQKIQIWHWERHAKIHTIQTLGLGDTVHANICHPSKIFDKNIEINLKKTKQQNLEFNFETDKSLKTISPKPHYNQELFV